MPFLQLLAIFTLSGMGGFLRKFYIQKSHEREGIILN